MFRKSKFRLAARLRFHLRQAVKRVPGLLNRAVRRGVFAFDLCSTFWARARYVYSDGDFVRNASLELASREIYRNKVAGAVAELGVFRGDYAKLINRAFPDRALYLFDTFDGFDDSEESADRMQGFSSRVDDFSYTSVDLVLRKMRHPENCVVRKGLFPGTATGVDERFAFVSIDCDLYQPIYQGLRFFWERLEGGGYIFVHDYQNPVYSGAKAAVDDFCAQYGVACFPMSDTCGSAAIAKPLPPPAEG